MLLSLVLVIFGVAFVVAIVTVIVIPIMDNSIYLHTYIIEYHYA